MDEYAIWTIFYWNGFHTFRVYVSAMNNATHAIHVFNEWNKNQPDSGNFLCEVLKVERFNLLNVAQRA